MIEHKQNMDKEIVKIDLSNLYDKIGLRNKSARKIIRRLRG
jgi:hypothetical protein